MPDNDQNVKDIDTLFEWIKLDMLIQMKIKKLNVYTGTRATSILKDPNFAKHLTTILQTRPLTISFIYVNHITLTA